MDFALWKAVLLGIVQGVTEFFPVSSSGHLVFVQSLVGMEHGVMTFDIFLHFGTLISIFIVFWSDLKAMLLFKPSHRHLNWLILTATLPAAVIGYVFKGYFERVFHSLQIVGGMLLITGVILWFSEKMAKRAKDIEAMRSRDALVIGLIQGLAMIPGISRSGSTMVGGLVRGLRRDQAAHFSFLMAIPVILGATVLEVKGMVLHTGAGNAILPMAAGMVAAAVSGYFAIRLLMKILRERTLRIFAYYCWFVGTLMILGQIFEII